MGLEVPAAAVAAEDGEVGAAAVAGETLAAPAVQEAQVAWAISVVLLPAVLTIAAPVGQVSSVALAAVAAAANAAVPGCSVRAWAAPVDLVASSVAVGQG